MFRKVDPFTKYRQLSRTHCVSVCADGASAIIRIKKTLLFYEKGKIKYLGSYCLLRLEEIRHRINLRRSDSFYITWEKNTQDAGGKEYTGEMGEEHTGRLFHLNLRWFMRKASGESGPRNDTGALLKEKNHNFAERYIDIKWIGKYS